MLSESEAHSGTLFGHALTSSPGYLFVAAPGRNAGDGTPGAGAVDVFQWKGGSPAWLTTIHAPEPEVNGQFGTTLAFHGQELVVGCPFCDAVGLRDAGKVYTFDVPGGLESPGNILTSTAPAEGGHYGALVEADQSVVLVREDLPDFSGRIHVYDTTGGTWSAIGQVDGAVPGALTGAALEFAKDGFLASSPGGEALDGQMSGNVTHYRFADGAVVPQQTLSFPNLPEGAGFGHGLALDRGPLALAFTHGSTNNLTHAVAFFDWSSSAKQWEFDVAPELPTSAGQVGRVMVWLDDTLWVGTSKARANGSEGGFALFAQQDEWRAIGEHEAVSPAPPNSVIGMSMVIWHDHVAVGAPSRDATVPGGSVYLFKLPFGP